MNRNADNLKRRVIESCEKSYYIVLFLFLSFFSAVQSKSFAEN